jgi:hypothetical protein
METRLRRAFGVALDGLQLSERPVRPLRARPVGRLACGPSVAMSGGRGAPDRYAILRGSELGRSTYGSTTFGF